MPNNERVKRTPIAGAKPIGLRLRSSERNINQKAAKDLGVSESNLARQAYLKGLPKVIDVEKYQGQ